MAHMRGLPLGQTIHRRLRAAARIGQSQEGGEGSHRHEQEQQRPAAARPRRAQGGAPPHRAAPAAASREQEGSDEEEGDGRAAERGQLQQEQDGDALHWQDREPDPRRARKGHGDVPLREVPHRVVQAVARQTEPAVRPAPKGLLLLLGGDGRRRAGAQQRAVTVHGRLRGPLGRVRLHDYALEGVEPANQQLVVESNVGQTFPRRQRLQQHREEVNPAVVCREARRGGHLQEPLMLVQGVLRRKHAPELRLYEGIRARVQRPLHCRGHRLEGLHHPGRALSEGGVVLVPEPRRVQRGREISWGGFGNVGVEGGRGRNHRGQRRITVGRSLQVADRSVENPHGAQGQVPGNLRLCSQGGLRPGLRRPQPHRADCLCLKAEESACVVQDPGCGAACVEQRGAVACRREHVRRPPGRPLEPCQRQSLHAGVEQGKRTDPPQRAVGGHNVDCGAQLVGGGLLCGQVGPRVVGVLSERLHARKDQRGVQVAHR
mmetsp:Transcript_6782/g.27767  ORF Transcript_6782/g.27767 Transcript_6782/m.27767 type:complete len:489 (-) Transcript_6782:3682-5148(-)